MEHQTSMKWLLSSVGVVAIAFVVIGAIRAGGGNTRFRTTCQAIRVGDPLGDAASGLAAIGGVYLGKVGSGHQWLRPARWSLRTATCVVADDAPPNLVAPDPHVPPPSDATVRSVRYVEGYPIM